MGRDMARLLRETDLPRRKLLVMGGHEEGIITFGNSPAEATQILLKEYARCESTFKDSSNRPQTDHG
jgi:hypothetical protein